MSAPLPTWIERLLGIQTGPGEGAVWRLDHTWTWPPWVTLVFVVLAVVFVVGTYLRESGRARRGVRLMLAAIRLTLIALVLAMLAQLALAIQRTGLPVLAVLVDDTLSMTIADRYEESTQRQIARQVEAGRSGRATRWELARSLLCQRDGRLLETLSHRYRLRLYYLTGPRLSQAEDVPQMIEGLQAAEPVGEQTRL
ncbi:MAG TPA: hypothetical protein EYP56_15375, partial [Planctomycetaceae bacterium]|nr:hypothetical protein [Planctomycetaceae bacterium]